MAGHGKTKEPLSSKMQVKVRVPLSWPVSFPRKRGLEHCSPSRKNVADCKSSWELSCACSAGWVGLFSSLSMHQIVWHGPCVMLFKEDDSLLIEKQCIPESCASFVDNWLGSKFLLFYSCCITIAVNIHFKNSDILTHYCKLYFIPLSSLSITKCLIIIIIVSNKIKASYRFKICHHKN